MQAHDDRNMARMLTPSERKAKKEKKLLGAAQEGEAALVSVFCIRDLSSPQNKFKVRVNAEVRQAYAGILLKIAILLHALEQSCWCLHS